MPPASASPPSPPAASPTVTPLPALFAKASTEIRRALLYRDAVVAAAAAAAAGSGRALDGAESESADRCQLVRERLARARQLVDERIPEHPGFAALGQGGAEHARLRAELARVRADAALQEALAIPSPQAAAPAQSPRPPAAGAATDRRRPAAGPGSRSVSASVSGAADRGSESPLLQERGPPSPPSSMGGRSPGAANMKPATAAAATAAASPRPGLRGGLPALGTPRRPARYLSSSSDDEDDWGPPARSRGRSKGAGGSGSESARASAGAPAGASSTGAPSTSGSRGSSLAPSPLPSPLPSPAAMPPAVQIMDRGAFPRQSGAEAGGQDPPPATATVTAASADSISDLEPLAVGIGSLAGAAAPGWRCSRHDTPTHDVFISYRDKSERNLAEKLVLYMEDSLTNRQLGRPTPQIARDKVCFVSGDHWKPQMVAALAGSALFVPLLTEAALEGMKRSHERSDVMLHEMELALELKAAGRVSILPLLVGAWGASRGRRVLVPFEIPASLEAFPREAYAGPARAGADAGAGAGADAGAPAAMPAPAGWRGRGARAVLNEYFNRMHLDMETKCDPESLEPIAARIFKQLQHVAPQRFPGRAGAAGAEQDADAIGPGSVRVELTLPSALAEGAAPPTPPAPSPTAPPLPEPVSCARHKVPMDTHQVIIVYDEASEPEAAAAQQLQRSIEADGGADAPACYVQRTCGGPAQPAAGPGPAASSSGRWQQLLGGARVMVCLISETTLLRFRAADRAPSAVLSAIELGLAWAAGDPARALVPMVLRPLLHWPDAAEFPERPHAAPGGRGVRETLTALVGWPGCLTDDPAMANGLLIRDLPALATTHRIQRAISELDADRIASGSSESPGRDVPTRAAAELLLQRAKRIRAPLLYLASLTELPPEQLPLPLPLADADLRGLIAAVQQARAFANKYGGAAPGCFNCFCSNQSAIEYRFITGNISLSEDTLIRSWDLRKVAAYG